MIRDQEDLNLGKSFLLRKCLSCLSESHNLENCPLVHFIPNKAGIIKKN